MFRSFVLFMCLYNDGADEIYKNVIIPVVVYIQNIIFPEGQNKNIKKENNISLPKAPVPDKIDVQKSATIAKNLMKDEED